MLNWISPPGFLLFSAVDSRLYFFIVVRTTHFLLYFYFTVILLLWNHSASGRLTFQIRKVISFWLDRYSRASTLNMNVGELPSDKVTPLVHLPRVGFWQSPFQKQFGQIVTFMLLKKATCLCWLHWCSWLCSQVLAELSLPAEKFEPIMGTCTGKSETTGVWLI